MHLGDVLLPDVCWYVPVHFLHKVPWDDRRLEGPLGRTEVKGEGDNTDSNDSD